MKSFLLSTLLTISITSAMAQSAAESVQKESLTYIQKFKEEGFQLRSQITTEFNTENASQSVILKLEKGYIYRLAAIGEDSNIDLLDTRLKTKSSDGRKVILPYGDQDRTDINEIVPAKSKRYTIDIDVDQFADGMDSGFLSFMVMRKKA